ncbi:Gar/GrdA family gentamicin resistance ATP-binding protein [Aliidiomarina soli]|uniref:AAA family ATPase n=1 Tax=Aliidiomarina soli TaxID=1928574 RepID=A0A432WMW4_9GAMM|nr:Gar/GrdA family gentamicin resistance ATP-binding protein [Aliidiomarina soli]RUO35088.1 hypothetical protein CWE14_03580 [Aliidiomarina soli]
MIILLNGPLGIGKTTLADALMESIDQCVMLDGDSLVAANPEPTDGLEHLHSTLSLLVPHYRKLGYQHFVIAHIWTSQEQIDDLRRRLASYDADFRCFLLTLPTEENLKRINRRASGRAVDEIDFELHTVAEEREMLKRGTGVDLGEPFDVSASPLVLVNAMLAQLGLCQ